MKDLAVVLTAGVEGIAANERGSVEGEVDLMNTLTWGGISGVFDAQGNPVDFLVESGSGTGWSQAISTLAVIPLPDAAWLLLSALGVLVGWRRQRRITA